MDAFEGFFAAMGVVVIAFLAGLVSYQESKATMRSEAVAAGVACYVASPTSSARPEFKWNCK